MYRLSLIYFMVVGEQHVIWIALESRIEMHWKLMGELGGSSLEYDKDLIRTGQLFASLVEVLDA